ncbi:MAG TPA: hypothetical protein VMC84_06510 [Methanocella sp.]|uniref:hypothetical protein n=1 Tax=Methanocella sp. TaxID=2052833 RepID=UPI002D037BC7|nr:hypothetical protein [Methanocella sp.]HTY90813.1 hypothetical protein [Methanocella sp.]
MVEPDQSTLSPKNVVVAEGKTVKIHYNWLRIMYAYTIVVAGGIGLLYLISPGTFMSLCGFPSEEPIFAGVAASVWVAFALLAILGLWSPLKFVPVLLMQLTYKLIWFIAVIIPGVIGGNLPSYSFPMVVIFATFIIGDLIAIPFNYVFAKD